MIAEFTIEDWRGFTKAQSNSPHTASITPIKLDTTVLLVILNKCLKVKGYHYLSHLPTVQGSCKRVYPGHTVLSGM